MYLECKVVKSMRRILTVKAIQNCKAHIELVVYMYSIRSLTGQTIQSTAFAKNALRLVHVTRHLANV